MAFDLSAYQSGGNDTNDPRHMEDPSSPWYGNPDWEPPDGYQFYGYTWNGGQPSLAPTNTPGSPGYDPNAPSLHQPIPPPGGTPPPPGTTPPPTNNGGNNPILPPGSIGSLLKPFDGTAPVYTDPRYPAAPSFPQIPNWQSPTGEEAANLPGYKFARDQGLEALQNSAAARGVTNTGGTLEDIVKFGDQFAGQNYQTARSNSLEDYQNNVASKFLLPYQAAYNTWSVQNPQAGLDAQNKNNFNWNNYLQGYNIFRNQGNDTYNRLFGLAQLGSGVQ